MHLGTSGSLAIIAARRGQAGRPGAGRSAHERRLLVHVEVLVLRLAIIATTVSGDGTWAEERSRPASLGPLGLPPAH